MGNINNLQSTKQGISFLQFTKILTNKNDDFCFIQQIFGFITVFFGSLGELGMQLYMYFSDAL